MMTLSSRIFLGLATAALLRLWVRLNAMAAGRTSGGRDTKLLDDAVGFDLPAIAPATTGADRRAPSDGKSRSNSSGDVDGGIDGHDGSIVVGDGDRGSNATTTMGFVHVGKTGGSTISKLLRNGCHSFVKKPCRDVGPNETIASRLIQSYYHVPDFQHLPKSPHSAFVVTIRDPYERTVSAFLYHHPRNVAHAMDEHEHEVAAAKARASATMNATTTTNSNTAAAAIEQTREQHARYAYRCFPTLEAFTGSLHRGNSTDCDYPYRPAVMAIENCAEFACAVVHGKVRHFIHLFFNYRNVLSKLLAVRYDDEEEERRPANRPRREIYAIRTERLRDDWRDLNRHLGAVEDPPPIVDAARDTSDLDLPVTKDASPDARRRLCAALESEYVAYYRILSLATTTTNTTTTSSFGEEEEEKDVVLGEARELARSSCPDLDHDRLLREAVRINRELPPPTERI